MILRAALLLLVALSIIACSRVGQQERKAEPESLTPNVASPQEQKGTTMAASEQEPRVQVSYSVIRDHTTLHEPILLQFAVTNGLKEPIVIDLGADRKEVFVLSIKKPDGSRVDVAPKLPEGSHEIGRVSLFSAQTFSQRLILNEWFDFSLIGKYEISVRLTKPHISLNEVNIYNLSNVPEFKTLVFVESRDPERLRQLCSELESKIIGNNDQARDSAEELSYVTDPVAVPYLEKLLKANKLLAGFAIAGLERIGDDAAIQVLNEASKSKDKYFTAILAKQALDRLSGGQKNQP